MNNTALGASNKKVLFISDAHEKFYNENMKKVRFRDVYHEALIYCLGINADVRNHISEVFDFKNGGVLPESLHAEWQTSGSSKVVRIAFNLFCNGMPSINSCTNIEEMLEESSYYSVEDIFCSEYAPFFWQAIQIRYPEYATYNFKLKQLFGGED